MQFTTKNIFLLGFGVASYLTCAGTIFHSAKFLYQTHTNLSVHYEPASRSVAFRLVINFLLVAFFGFTHSYFAKDQFKKYFVDVIADPNSQEPSDIQHKTLRQLYRSTYVLVTSLIIESIIAMWQPITDKIVWFVDPKWNNTLWYLYVFGWLLIFAETWVMDHFELIGIKQIYYLITGREEPLSEKNEAAQKLYKDMRHPIVIAALLVLWVTPVMTIDRFLLSLGTTMYLIVGNQVDEEDVNYVEAQLAAEFKRLTSN